MVCGQKREGKHREPREALMDNAFTNSHQLRDINGEHHHSGWFC
ncbi:hypothetical protein [Vibrio vulnificus YJ016]|uniref:Uncharacterized protein n=1 Tax=Vibrio vulnificus (strain YJ016) TaxID=196600 RepID=Q7MBT1_VIBVY|nr:hypothetical protein [Vibrio vulnificus YJ016]